MYFSPLDLERRAEGRSEKSRWETQSVSRETTQGNNLFMYFSPLGSREARRAAHCCDEGRSEKSRRETQSSSRETTRGKPTQGNAGKETCFSKVG